MIDIVKNIKSVKKTLSENITLVAVSKTKPSEMIMEAYKSGHRIFGENKVQELVYKSETLPDDIVWHMIGHLQTNKVKHIAPFVKMIHSVDSVKLLVTINKEAKKNNRVIDCLLQVKIASEETKFGLTVEQIKDILRLEEISSLENIRIVGLMGMATFTNDKLQIRQEFRNLKRIFDNIKQGHFTEEPSFKEISMGMSGDYEIAVEEGSTIIRVGSHIFGERIYT